MKFYLQQVAATVAILATTVAVVYALTSTSSNTPVEPLSLNQPSVRREMRGEETGEVLRVHHFNADGVRTHLEITFRDGVKAHVQLDLRGRITRAVETRRDGSYLVIHFRQGVPVKYQLFDAGNVRLKEAVSTAGGSLTLTRFAADGTTPVVVDQAFEDGTHNSTLYWSDGKTVRARFEGSEEAGKLVIFNEQGVRVAEESFQEVYETEPLTIGSKSVGYERLRVEIKRYEDDGRTTRLQVRWRYAVYGSYRARGVHHLVDGEEVAGGKRIRRVSTIVQTQQILRLIEEPRTGRKRYLNLGNQLVREESGGVPPKVVAYSSGTRPTVSLELLNPPEKATLLPQLIVPEEEHHLEQILQ